MYEDGGVGGSILDEKKFGNLVVGINFMRDREDNAMGKAFISFRDHWVLHWCRNTWSGMSITDAMGRTNVIRAEVAKQELILPMTSSLGVSIRPGNKAFCIPQRHREKDSEESLNMEQADRELSTRLMSEARRRSAIDHGRRMMHGASYDESLSTRSAMAGVAFDALRGSNRCLYCGEMGHMKRECPSEHKRMRRQCEICGKLGHSRGACYDPYTRGASA